MPLPPGMALTCGDAVQGWLVAWRFGVKLTQAVTCGYSGGSGDVGSACVSTVVVAGHTGHVEESVGEVLEGECFTAFDFLPRFDCVVDAEFVGSAAVTAPRLNLPGTLR